MYLDYWQLAAKPFEPQNASEAFYFPSESHEGAISKLRYAVDEGRNAAVLAGPSGVGKTMIVDRIAESIAVSQATTKGKRPVVRLTFPQLSSRDLLAYLAEKLQAPVLGDQSLGTVEESVRRLEKLAELNSAEGIRPLVVIDEAHLLEDSGALETLRLLTNFRLAGSTAAPALTFLLVGQMGLLSSVSRHPSLDERLAVKTLLRGLTAQETASYARHRLAAAGAMREIFTERALQHLHTLTGGFARQINRLADLALVVGYADQKPQIEPQQLEAVHRELVTLGGD